MTNHIMEIDVDVWRAQYGYRRNQTLRCSCGHTAVGGKVAAEAHRQAVIEEALGVRFEVRFGKVTES